MTTYNELKRDAQAVKAALAMPKQPGGPVIAKKNIKVVFPYRFVDRDMAFLGTNNQVIGVVAIVVDGVYAVLSACALFQTEPVAQDKVTWFGRDYVELSYEPGSVVFKTLELVKNDVMVYRIYDELISKGNVPWYMGYEDLAGVFATAKKHAGTNLADSVEVTELIVSLIARQKGELVNYYRTQIKTREDLTKIQPAFIGMINAAYAPTNTLNRIAGSYFDVGVTASIVYPTDRVEKMEAIIRA